MKPFVITLRNRRGLCRLCVQTAILAAALFGSMSCATFSGSENPQASFSQAMDGACTARISCSSFISAVHRKPDYVHKFSDAELWSYRFRASITNIIEGSNQVSITTCALFIKINPAGQLNSWFWDAPPPPDIYRSAEKAGFNWNALLKRVREKQEE